MNRQRASRVIRQAGGIIQHGDAAELSWWDSRKWVRWWLHDDAPIPAIGMYIGEDIMGVIARMQSELEGVNVTLTAQAALDSLRWFPEVRVVNLAGSPIDGNDLEALSLLVHLQELNLASTNVDDNGLRHLASARTIERMNLSGTRVTGSGLRHLTKSSLRSLVLGAWDSDVKNPSIVSGPSWLNDDGLKYVALITSLEELDLRNANITGRGLQHLVSLPNLQVLNLRGVKIDDRDVRYLSQIDTLVEIDLSNTGISDDALDHLAKLPLLSRLNLADTNVTYDALDAVQRSRPSLDLLDELDGIVVVPPVE